MFFIFFFHETTAYLKGNSKIKEEFFQENSYTEIRKTYFLAPKLGVDLYTGSTYTRVNTVGESPANNYARFFVGFEHFAGCCTANTSHANIKNTCEKETVRYQNDYLFLPSVMQLSDFK